MISGVVLDDLARVLGITLAGVTKLLTRQSAHVCQCSELFVFSSVGNLRTKTLNSYCHLPSVVPSNTATRVILSLHFAHSVDVGRQGGAGMDHADEPSHPLLSSSESLTLKGSCTKNKVIMYMCRQLHLMPAIGTYNSHPSEECIIAACPFLNVSKCPFWCNSNIPILRLLGCHNFEPDARI